MHTLIRNSINGHTQAEKIVTGLLEKTPDSPKLLCILGDLRQDPALWQRAWDVSGSRYARAMRTLGSWHYRRQDYPLAIECYEHALSINALFESTWFTLGCAAMQVDNWPVAQRAFLRCVEIEPGNGEAWNNLAAIHIKCSRKLDAFRCLREGLKEQYDNWKMWENFLFLSLDLGEFGESLCAVDRLLETNWGKQRERIDVGAVRVLCEGVLGLVAQLNKELHGDATSGVESNIEGADCTDDGTLATTTTHFRIVDRVEHLLDRIIAEFDSTNPELFDIAARFHTARNHHKRALDARLAAYRTVSQSAVGEEALSDAEAFEQLAAVAMALVEAYEVAQREGVVADGPFQSRLLLRNLVKKTKVGGKCVCVCVACCVRWPSIVLSPSPLTGRIRG